MPEFRYATYWRVPFVSGIETEHYFHSSSTPSGEDSVAAAVAAVKAWNSRIKDKHYFLKPRPEDLP